MTTIEQIEALFDKKFMKLKNVLLIEIEKKIMNNGAQRSLSLKASFRNKMKN